MVGKFKAGDKIERPIGLAIGNPIAMVEIEREEAPGMYRCKTPYGIAMLLTETELGADPELPPPPPPPPPPPIPVEVTIKDDGVRADVGCLRTDVDALKVNVADLSTELGKLLPPDPVVGEGG